MATDSCVKDNITWCLKSNFVYKGITWSKVTTSDILRRCEQFQFLPDDIIVATFPRSGTTVTQEIVWHIVNHEIIKKDEQYGSIFQRFPFLEMNLKSLNLPGSLPIDILESQTSKRLIKTHLPYFFIRDQFEKVNPKIIVVMRNPKDNVVSCYNFYKGIQSVDHNATFNDYLQIYLARKTFYGDVVDHNLQYWALRDRQNVLIVRYEDIVYQPFQQVRTIASFLGYSLSEEKIATIVHNTTFATMQKNKDVNITLHSGTDKLLRKGKCGDWKNWLTVAQNKAMDAWIEERLNGAGLCFTDD